MASLSEGYNQDQAATLVGVEVEEVRAGYARGRLQIRDEHLNGHGTVHGGITFLFADTIFAYACNSRGVPTVATNCEIVYQRPVNPDERLQAVAEEQYLEGRKGLYDVTVTNQADQVVAHFRGHSMALGRS